MFVRIAVRFVEVQMPDKACKGHLLSTDSAAILTKQAERQFTSKKTPHSKNCWHFISDKENPL